ncbi:hypothetical protein CPB84DRAFT_1689804, partial [Gymnopilus junonius]
VAIALLIIIILYLRSQRCRHLPYPHGPRKLPLLGSLFEVLTTFEWERYVRWGKQYNSDVIPVRLAGRDIFVLNSFTAATALLDKKLAIYSSRFFSLYSC